MTLLTMTLAEAESYTSKLIDKLFNVSVEIVKKLIVVLLIWFIGKKAISLFLKFLTNAFTKGKMDVSLMKFLLSLIKFTLYAVLAVTIIGSLGIETTSLITLIGSLGLTVGLSLQGSLSNFAGGVLILLFKPFRVGDYIVACGCEGTVQVIDLLYTRLYTIDNKTITIPNGTLANSNITNVACEPFRKVSVSIDVSYDTDINKAKEVLLRAVNACDRVIKDREIDLFIDELGASGITLTSRFWVKTEDYWPVTWQMREDFKSALDKASISIPFPQMDVHISQEKS